LLRHFTDGENVGIVLGELSGDLVDVDLDAAEARKLAPQFLPPTNSIFGRASEPKAHWLYVAHPLPDTQQFADPAGEMLAEIRASGRQTMFPPSAHPDTGEIVRWNLDRMPAGVDGHILLTRVKRLASAALLARHWQQGIRQELTLALAGALIRGGWSTEETKNFVRAVAWASNDEETVKRVDACEDTMEKMGEGRPITGLPRLTELLGTETGDKVQDWLSLRPELPEKVASLIRPQDTSWPEEVEGAALLKEVEELVRHYVVLPTPEAGLVISAWVLSTFCFDLFEQHPFLFITSPEKRCGKTRLLEVLEQLVDKPLSNAGMSEAVFFRAADTYSPTFLIDEAQHLRDRNERSWPIHDLLCAANRKGKPVLRMAESKQGWQLVSFNIYCPKAIASIGKLTDIIMDRGIEIALRRRRESEQVARFFSAIAKRESEPVRQRIVRWIKDNRGGVRTDYVSEKPPAFGSDREVENWAPLFAIVRTADPTSVGRLETAAWALTRTKVEACSTSVGVQLLRDVKSVFERHGTDFISTAILVDGLCQMEESPWKDFRRGHPLTPHALADLLRPYEIHSTRDTVGKVRGYYQRDFEDTWSRYSDPVSVKVSENQLGAVFQPSEETSRDRVTDGLGRGVNAHGS